MNEPSPDRKSVFGRALELPSADRAAYLDAVCAGHPAVRAEVEELLRAHGGAGSFMNPPADLGAATLSAPGSDPGLTRSHLPAPGQEGALVAGRYKLLQQIGEGGMGTVWMAEQTEPVKRRVAVKLVRVERGASKTILSRFEAERQAIALMNHPNIAKLLDAGTTDDGAPFFVMELVKGVPLTEFCDAHKLSVPERLDLFRQICSAVQHAHQKGVIHRDLKPTNILVESHDGKPVPKVIDFGLAKATTGLQLTEHTLFTAFGTVAGTPLYMAPEQATFNAIDVDSRADIYALGVILYELLSGSTPIPKETLKSAALDEMLRVIREQEPPPPSSRISTSSAPGVAAARQSEPAKLGRFVRGELDWIVMKALSKERDRRYESATALAADVERFMAHEPVTAGPPSQWYRLRKFVRRNKGRVTAAVAAALLLVAGVVGTSLGMLAANRATARAVAEEEKAVAERDEKVKALDAETLARQAEVAAKERLQASVAAERQAAYDLTIPLVQKALADNDPAQASALLATCPENLREWEWHFLNRQFDRGVVLLRPGYSQYRARRGHDQFSADGKLLVQCEGAKATVRDATTGEVRHSIDVSRGAGACGNSVRVSPNGRLLAAWYNPAIQETNVLGSAIENPVLPAKTSLDITLIAVETGKPVAKLTGLPERVRSVLFSPDSGKLATCGLSNEVRVWDAAGKLLHTLTCDGAEQAVPVAFTPDGRALVTNSVAGEQSLQIDGTFLKGRGEFRVWDLETGKKRVSGSLAPYTDRKSSAKGGPLVPTLPNGTAPFARISPDGRYAVGLASDVFHFVVDLTTGEEAWRLPGGYKGLGFGPSGSLVALNGFSVCSVFEVPTGRVLISYPLTNSTDLQVGTYLGRNTELSANGRWLCVYQQSLGVVEVRDFATGWVVRAVPFMRLNAGSLGSHGLVTADGSRLLTSAPNGEQKLWDLTASTAGYRVNLTAKALRAPYPLAISRDGRRVAVLLESPQPDKPGTTRNLLELVDLHTGTSRVLEKHLGVMEVGVYAHAVFSPDGRKIAALIGNRYTNGKNSIRDLMGFAPAVWDVETGALEVLGSVIQVRLAALYDDGGVPRLAFSKDGVPLVAVSIEDEQNPANKSWRIQPIVPEGGVATPLAVIPAGSTTALSITEDGRFAAVLGRSFDAPAVEVWDNETKRMLWSVPAELARHDNLRGLFSQDGSRLVLTDAQPITNIPGQIRDATPRVRVWETRTGRAFTEFRLPTAATNRGLSVSPDGRRVFYTGDGSQEATLVFNAETGRELVARIDDQDGFLPGVQPRALVTAEGKLIRIAKQSERRAGPVGFSKQLMIWDGSRTERPATPATMVDNWLTEALQLTESTDPALRNPQRAVEILSRAREFYPNNSDIESAYGLALLRAKRIAEACDVLVKCVEQEEQREGAWRLARNDKRMKGQPAVWSMRHPAVYFLMALAAAESGDRERAKVWYSWGEACIICPESFASGAAFSIGDREGERARAEPFRQEVARLLGLPAPPLAQLLRDPLKFDPMHAGNRMMRVNANTTAETIGTSLWAMEFLLKHSEPEGGILYNAGCFYALSSGKVPARRDEFGNRAMALLQQATKAGFKKADVARTDTDLDPLRGRDDFKQWLAELITSAKPPEPAPPPTPKQ